MSNRRRPVPRRSNTGISGISQSAHETSAANEQILVAASELSMLEESLSGQVH